MSGENTVSSDEKALDVEALPFAPQQTDAEHAHLGAWYVDDGVGVEFFETFDSAEDYAKDVYALDLRREVERLHAERDRARSIAVALEQELARKDQALDEIRALHWKADGIGICELCGSWPCDTQRVLAALDAQLNKEDDQ